MTVQSEQFVHCLNTFASRKYRETSGDLTKTKRELEEAQSKIQALQEIRDARDSRDAADLRDSAESCDYGDAALESTDSNVKEESGMPCGVEIKKEHEDEASAQFAAGSGVDDMKEDPDSKKDIKKEIKSEPGETKTEASGVSNASVSSGSASVQKALKEMKNLETEIIRDLKAQLKLVQFGFHSFG